MFTCILDAHSCAGMCPAAEPMLLLWLVVLWTSCSVQALLSFGSDMISYSADHTVLSADLFFGGGWGG